MSVCTIPTTRAVVFIPCEENKWKISLLSDLREFGSYFAKNVYEMLRKKNIISLQKLISAKIEQYISAGPIMAPLKVPVSFDECAYYGYCHLSALFFFPHNPSIFFFPHNPSICSFYKYWIVLFTVSVLYLSVEQGYSRTRAQYCTMIEIGRALGYVWKLGWAHWEHSQHPKPNLAGVYLDTWSVS